MFKTLLLEIKDGIATIGLNRPESNNAFDELMFRETAMAVERCDKDHSIKIIIITGKGRNFSSGGDINAMASFDFITPELSALAGKMTRSVKICSKPVIAMVNGAAAGAAFGLALACDFRIMTKESAFLSAFSNIALSGDSGTIYHLYHIVGLAKTTELMIFSKPIKGEEAKQMGLTTFLAEDGHLKEDTIKFAESLKARPLAAFARQKKIYNEIFYHDYAEYCLLEEKLFVESAQTDDHHEAVMAFLEKRKPLFSGK